MNMIDMLNSIGDIILKFSCALVLFLMAYDIFTNGWYDEEYDG